MMNKLKIIFSMTEGNVFKTEVKKLFKNYTDTENIWSLLIFLI